MSNWNDAPPPPTSGTFVKFDAPGVSVSGVVAHVDPKGATTMAGAQCPLIVIDGTVTRADGRTETNPAWQVSCSQAKLWEAAVNARPEVGEVVTITYTHTEPRPGGKTLKHFTITRGTPNPVQSNPNPVQSNPSTIPGF